MHTRARTTSVLLTRLRAALTPAGFAYYCTICRTYYDPSDPNDSYPHNNH